MEEMIDGDNWNSHKEKNISQGERKALMILCSHALIVGLIWGLIMSMDKKIVFRVLCFLIKKQ